jgi:hypothetical protein
VNTGILKSGVLAFCFALASCPLSSRFSLESSSRSIFQDTMCQATQRGQFALLGDPVHSDVRFMEFLGRPETMAAFDVCGIKKIYTEIPDSMQTAVDGYASGTLTKAQFLRAMDGVVSAFYTGKAKVRNDEAIASLIQNAHDHGIGVKCVSSSASIASMNDPRNLSPDLRRSYPQYQQMSMMIGMVLFQSLGQGYENRYEAKQIQKLMNDYIDSWDDGAKNWFRDMSKKITMHRIRMRLDDTQLATDISSDAGTEKAVVAYGFNHINTDNPKGIDALLSLKGVTTIALYFNEQTYDNVRVENRKFLSLYEFKEDQNILHYLFGSDKFVPLAPHPPSPL